MVFLHRTIRKYPRGFTLVELSVVLVIISLLVSSILVGRDLIRSAQMRAIAKNIDGLNTAINAFQLKYNCLPGDCPNATQFFGVSATCPNVAANQPGTCNGNGDRSYYPFGGTWLASEIYYATVELYKADLWSLGRFGNLANGALEARGALATDFMYIFTNDLYYGAGALPINGKTGNTFVITSLDSGAANATVLSAQETWQIDVKMDDGTATGGRLMGRDAAIPDPNAINLDVPCVASGGVYDQITPGARCKILYYWSN